MRAPKRAADGARGAPESGPGERAGGAPEPVGQRGMRIPLSPSREQLRRSRAWAAAAALLLTAWGLVACGGSPPPGGHGALVHERGKPDLLVLEGSPYEMGWWHGHLLRDRILALRERWEAALFQATVGSPTNGADGKGAAGALRAHCDICEDQTRHNLPERMLQELDGMAAATGLEPRELVWIDVLRDALRMKGLEPRLVGAAGLARTTQGLEARGWWTGPDTDVLAEEWLVIHRKPKQGPETVLVSWPGSLGGVAALTRDGRGYILAGAEVADRRRQGFGAGRPFNISAREALPASDSVGLFMAMTKATMGHVLLAFSTHPGRDEHPVKAMGAFVYYVDPDPPRVMGEQPFLAVPPYENPHDPRARALREALRAGVDEPEERWQRLRAHADARGEARGDGPRVVLRHDGAGGALSFRAGGDGAERTVELP